MFNIDQFQWSIIHYILKPSQTIFSSIKVSLIFRASCLSIVPSVNFLNNWLEISLNCKWYFYQFLTMVIFQNFIFLLGIDWKLTSYRMLKVLPQWSSTIFLHSKSSLKKLFFFFFWLYSKIDLLIYKSFSSEFLTKIIFNATLRLYFSYFSQSFGFIRNLFFPSYLHDK